MRVGPGSKGDSDKKKTLTKVDQELRKTETGNQQRQPSRNVLNNQHFNIKAQTMANQYMDRFGLKVVNLDRALSRTETSTRAFIDFPRQHPAFHRKRISPRNNLSACLFWLCLSAEAWI